MSRIVPFAGWLVGALLRSLHGAFGTALVAGLAFTACQLGVVYVLGRTFPDRDLLPQTFEARW